MVVNRSHHTVTIDALSGAKARVQPREDPIARRRCDPRARVIVLAINPRTRFDENAVLDLEAAVGRLHEQRKRLILSGITTHQFKALDALGVARMMDINNLCPDLEFAIARAMAVLELIDVERRRVPRRLSA